MCIEELCIVCSDSLTGEHRMPGRDSLSRVSVIIPTYNRSKLLQLAVESVLAQTYPAVEIIVVDDGSTDDTEAVMEQYAGRITYIKQDNQGVAAARNAGIRVASGEYLNFLDDDDRFMPAKIERQVQILDSRSEIGLVHCRYYHIDEDGNRLSEAGLLPEGKVLKELVCGCFVWSGAPLIRRQCLDQVGLFDEETWSTSEDWDMWLRIAQAGYPFACVQEPLGAYRILPDSRMADVARLEHGVFAVLDRVFADSQLPANVVALKEQAYGTMRCWMSCRCYAAGRWNEAKRNLTESLALRPQLLEHPEDLLQVFYHHALSAHVSDPAEFITGLFDHLPLAADGLWPYRSHLLGQVYAELALRSYGLGDIAEAKDKLAEAITLDPAILDQSEAFAESLCNYAMYQSGSAPHLYVDTVLQNLPDGAQRLVRVRSRVLSNVSIGCAFRDYSAGRWRLVIRQVLTALRYRPSWLGNRGVVSIFLKSLLNMLTTICRRSAASFA
jgi:tetratricopeptide (TPR) repeat protein